MLGTYNRLHVLGFAFATGITWGIAMFVLGLLAMLINWGTPLVQLMSSMYIGFSPTFFGSIIGAILGFIDGFIGGLILAFLYNLFLRYGKEPLK